MGHGLDVCMGDPREARTIEECLESEFVRTLVCQAGLVISGHKPAAVFGFTPRAWEGRGPPSEARPLRPAACHLRRLHAPLRPLLGGPFSPCRRAHAACLAPLAGGEDRCRRTESRVPGVHGAALRRRLGAHGRARRPPARLLRRAGRLSPRVGPGAGLPVDDVRGFMADGGRGAKVVGRWRCYGNVENARRRFDELARRERECRLNYARARA